MKIISKFEPAGQADVQTLKHAKALDALADGIITAHIHTGTKYLELCQYIRKHQLAPKLVSYQLSNRGFHKVQVSKINRIAMASDENFSQFEARLIGIDKVLELERGNVVEAIGEESGETPLDVERQVAELTQARSEGASGDTMERKARSLDKALMAVLRCAEIDNVRKRTAELNGWTVTVSKIKGYKPKKVSVVPGAEVPKETAETAAPTPEQTVADATAE